MINRMLLLYLSLLLTLTFTGCNQDKTVKSIAELTRENKELKRELNDLRVNTNEKNRSNREALHARVQHLDNEISYYQKVIKELLENNVSNNNFGIFNPKQITKGEKISDLTVENINDSDSESKIDITFKGKFIMKGDVFVSKASGNYLFRVQPGYLAKIPKTIKDLEKGAIVFMINNPNKLIDSLADKSKMIDDSNALNIKAEFTNYRYLYIPESDAVHSANIETLITE
ncbi:hypothetical protein LC040_06420 [Bacillus tianshenii]|nr:hypothetical protein LC040_06420 [Bacillus tianshenii]